LRAEAEKEKTPGKGRNSVLIELNPEYVKMAEQRTSQSGLFCGGGGRRRAEGRRLKTEDEK